jgi:hypothetical protein
MTDVEIPELELDLFLNTVTVAVDAAAVGEWVAGYWELVYGLERARGGVVEDAWAPELVHHYHQALTAYTREHLPRN